MLIIPSQILATRIFHTIANTYVFFLITSPLQFSLHSRCRVQLIHVGLERAVEEQMIVHHSRSSRSRSSPSLPCCSCCSYYSLSPIFCVTDMNEQLDFLQREDKYIVTRI